MAFLTTFAVTYRYPGDQAVDTDSKDSIKTMEIIRALLRWRLGLGK
jgi:hypothetical protein